MRTEISQNFRLIVFITCDITITHMYMHMNGVHEIMEKIRN